MLAVRRNAVAVGILETDLVHQVSEACGVRAIDKLSLGNGQVDLSLGVPVSQEARGIQMEVDIAASLDRERTGFATPPEREDSGQDQDR
jgi:hypothetical protein